MCHCHCHSQAAGQNRHVCSCRTEPSKTTSQEQSHNKQHVSQTHAPIRVKAAPSNVRQTVPATSPPPHDSGGMSPQKMKLGSRAVTMQHHAHRKSRHPTTMTFDVYARQASSGRTPPRRLFTVAWLGTSAAHTSAGTWRSDSLRHEPTASKKRDLHKEQSSALGLSSPKLTSESHRMKGLQPNPRDLWLWVRKVAALSSDQKSTKNKLQRHQLGPKH